MNILKLFRRKDNNRPIIIKETKVIIHRAIPANTAEEGCAYYFGDCVKLKGISYDEAVEAFGENNIDIHCVGKKTADEIIYIIDLKPSFCPPGIYIIPKDFDWRKLGTKEYKKLMFHSGEDWTGKTTTPFIEFINGELICTKRSGAFYKDWYFKHKNGGRESQPNMRKVKRYPLYGHWWGTQYDEKRSSYNRGPGIIYRTYYTSRRLLMKGLTVLVRHDPGGADSRDKLNPFDYRFYNEIG